MKGAASVPADLSKYEKMEDEEGDSPRSHAPEKDQSKSRRFVEKLWHDTKHYGRQRMPFLDWIPGYSFKESLLSDIIGGTTIGMVCMAQTLAHAAIASTKPIQGPYCAFMPAIVYAFFGTSPHASVSSGAIAAIIIADQLRPWSNIDDRTQMASFLSFISGITLIIVGLFKLSFAVRFLSQPCISGFITGGSILIVTQQLKNLCGFYSDNDCAQMGHPASCVPFPHTDQFLKLCQALIQFIPHIDTLSLVLGIIFMVMLHFFNELKSKSKQWIKEKNRWGWPAKRLAEMKEIVVVLLAASFGYLTCDAAGKPILTTIGEIPAGLPPFQVPWDIAAVQGLMRNEVPMGKAGESPWIESPGLLKSFITGGALVAFTTFLTTYATAKKMAIKLGYPLDPAQEMIGLGSAGVAGSFFGAFSPSGSLSRTGLAEECGVKTQLGGIFCAAVIALGLMYLTPALQFLPKTTLAAIIINSTKSLIDFSTPRKLWGFWRPTEDGGLRRDLIVWVLAFFFTVYLGVLEGIAIAVVFSVALVVADAAAPQGVVLGKVEVVGRKWRNVKDWPDAKQTPGIMVFEFRGPLMFASAEWFSDVVEKKKAVIEKETGHKIQIMVLSFASVHNIDYTALAILEELVSGWKKNGVGVVVSGAKHRVRHLIAEELGTRAKLIQQPNLMLSIGEAVELAQKRLSTNQSLGYMTDSSFLDRTRRTKQVQEAARGSLEEGLQVGGQLPLGRRLTLAF
mmetsp:Transcript_20584/g.45039  ORF Transcript_20584/g.45039 Transcript_20584/m.45039 type:complete len:735 (-) Transcript_20584:295-2499(-)